MSHAFILLLGSHCSLAIPHFDEGRASDDVPFCASVWLKQIISHFTTKAGGCRNM